MWRVRGLAASPSSLAVYCSKSLMYFDFEDYHPDTPTMARVISWREGVLLSIIVHLVMIILILAFPQIFPQDVQAARARLLAAQQARADKQPTFVFVQPKIDRPAPKRLRDLAIGLRQPAGLRRFEIVRKKLVLRCVVPHRE